MRYFLALDAGGTRTTGALGDGGAELARATGDSIKVLRTDPENARRNLETLLAQLSSQAGVDLKSIARTCIGIAGVRTARVANWIRAALPALVGGDLLLCGDEEIALDAAFRGGPGVLVVAGTGSNAVGRGADGQMAFAGGWGPYLGDQGSGHWIGQEALREALRARDEGRSSALLEAAAESWGLCGPDWLAHLVERANAASPPDFSGLAPVVASCAQAGDPVARATLRHAGEELARLARLVASKLQSAGKQPAGAAPALRVAFAGNVLAPNGQVRSAAIAALRHSHSQLEIVLSPVDPVAGALWRARNESKLP